jgi:hypothetical protein
LAQLVEQALFQAGQWLQLTKEVSSGWRRRLRRSDFNHGLICLLHPFKLVVLRMHRSRPDCVRTR